MIVLAELAAAFACAAALVLTAVAQTRKVNFVRRLKSHDVFALMPVWTFFAPNPGTTDTRVLWRERLVDGAVSAWREIEPPTGGLLRTVWNPRKRIRKAITDAAPIVARRAASEPDNKLLLVSIPFLMLLNHVSSQPASPLAAARQFVIVQTAGADDEEGEPRILLVSNWHALTPESAHPEPRGATAAPTEPAPA